MQESNGNMYAVWMDARFSFFTTGAFRYDSIAFSQSTDGGSSWSAPIQVNLTPNSEPLDDRQAFTLSVDVAADGTLAVSYYDFRENTPSRRPLLRKLRQRNREIGIVRCQFKSQRRVSVRSARRR